MKPVIRVENLGKQYTIGSRRKAYGSLRESLTEAVKKPFQRWRRNGHSRAETIWALRDVNFEVMPGEVVGIIGRNGAGKSTLLKILSRITEPTTGTVELHGKVGSLLEVGTGFHPELTGRENIYLNGAVLGMKRLEISRKFDEIVAFAEIEKFLDTPVKHYSSGMYMRLAFAVAAYLDPEILVVDEVLAVGDAGFQKKCLGKMGEVAESGRTVLLVSHNIPAIEGLCSRVVVMESGKILYRGETKHGIDYYHEGGNKNCKLPLIDRVDRIGDGKARITSITIFGQNGRETNQINMGDSFTVELRSKGKVKKAIIGILFGNAYRQQIIRGYTWEQVASEVELTGDDTISCYFENFPMMHGTYNIHTWIGQGNNSISNNCIDHIENAAELVIVPKDVFGTGRMVDPLGGVAFCKGEWVINGRHYV
jgi:lipopolysaccharide transport system ATP-binding protein